MFKKRSESNAASYSKASATKDASSTPTFHSMMNEAEVVNENGKVDDGVYCAGWIATGPTGVIVDTMTSSFQVARTILADLESGRVSGTKSGRGFDGVRDILRKEHRIVTFPNWEKIDTME